jgi:thiamine-monophosphate kinase
VQNLPYLDSGLHVCELAHMPPALLFLGGCGEYELLFTINPALESAFLTAATSEGCVFYRLGGMTASGRELVTNDLVMDLASLDNQARDYESPQQYLAALIEWLKQQDKRRTL